MLDYRPDLDPRTPELVTALTDMVPSARGYRQAFADVAHTAHTYTLGAGEAWPNIMFASRWLSQPGGIVLVGSNTRISLYEYTNGFINVSKAGDYALGTPAFQYGEDSVAAFDFCAFGDIIVACNKAVNTQKRSALDLTIATLFADLTDGITPPPKANTCCVAANFVFLGDCASYSTVTGSPDILAWSAIGDYLNWAVNPTITQASYAQFNDTPGAITAVRPLRDGVVVFKAESMYLGRYVGTGTNSPIWDFVRISDKIGCLGHRSVTSIDNALAFVGRDDVYAFDGTRPTPITRGIIETMRPNLLPNGNFAAVMGHDKRSSAVWVCTYAGGIYVWNYKYDRWGQMRPLADKIVPCNTNVDDFRTKTIASVTDGSQSFTTSTNHYNLYTLYMMRTQPRNRNTTRSIYGLLDTRFYGDPVNLLTLSRVNPIYGIRPSPATSATIMATMSRVAECPPTPSSSEVDTSKVALNATSFRADFLSNVGITANYIKFRHESTVDCEVLDIVPTLTKAGMR
jgi:hypothetical protein